jgi:FAD/FMN-containing dehydrogenase
MAELQSWGRYPRTRQAVRPVFWRHENPFAGAGPYLAYGLGRSYGDSCLNDGGTLLATSRLDRFIAFDRKAGLLACEAGVSLEAILALAVPLGWFPPVVPGTKHVTVGGAIANDVHGKNHHRAGTFGCHVEELELLRSSGERVVCSPRERPELFAATVGGLGLTGLILAATIRLRPVTTERVVAESIALRDLAEFLEVSRASDAEHEYTVAWVDCLASGRRLGRGILHRGDHAEGPGPPRAIGARARLSVPLELPVSPLNRVTLGAFNLAYYAKNRLAAGRRSLPYEPFFFPLDGIDRWNRIYGKKGLLQFQCVVPADAAPTALREMLGATSRAGEGSFLAVLKNFGSVRSPGLLSFPREGVTLALDFPKKGERTDRLFRELHAMVASAGGAIYPAKDAHMSPAQFAAQCGERLGAFRAQMDPAFSSSFWRRVTRDG